MQAISLPKLDDARIDPAPLKLGHVRVPRIKPGLPLFLSAGICLVVWWSWQPALAAASSSSIAFLLVMTVGMLHGCLDFEVAASQQRTSSRLRFSAIYNLQIALIAAVWIWSQQVAIWLFFASTAWHFGESDDAILKLNLSWPVRVLLGAALIGWVISTHLTRNYSDWQQLGVVPIGSAANIVIEAGLATLSLCIITAILLSSTASWPTIGLVFIALGFMAWLPLVPAFTLYFGFWHSLQMLYFLKEELHLNWQQLILKGLPYLLATYGLFAVLYLFRSFLPCTMEVLVMAVVSCLTLPHALCMHHLFERRA